MFCCPEPGEVPMLDDGAGLALGIDVGAGDPDEDGIGLGVEAGPGSMAGLARKPSVLPALSV